MLIQSPKTTAGKYGIICPDRQKISVLIGNHCAETGIFLCHQINHRRMFIYFHIIKLLNRCQKLTGDLSAGDVLMKQNPRRGMPSLSGKDKGTMVIFKVHAIQDQIINNIP